MHGGNLQLISEKFSIEINTLIDFSVNINPLGYPVYTRQIISSSLSEIGRYPDPEYIKLRSTIAEQTRHTIESVAVGNGTSELLLFTLIAIRPAKLILPVPCYIDYARFAQQNQIEIELFHLKPENNFEFDGNSFETTLSTVEQNSAVLFSNPNNPTGSIIENNTILQWCDNYPEITFIVDEAYGDFHDEQTHKLPKNLIRIRSLTKNFAIPGLRLGYLLAEKQITDRIRSLLPPWSVNTLAENLGIQLIKDRSFLDQSRDFINSQKEWIIQGLSNIPGIQLFPSSANFLLFKLQDQNPSTFYEKMIRQGIVLRWCHDYDGLNEQYFRLGIRGEKENQMLVQALQSCFPITRSTKKKIRKTPALMFQGTSSNAGKSLMTAAYCRVLSDLGIKAAPFKAQNMSLNSAVTTGGFEIGRAQALQAKAARVNPDPRMNPVLLKPNSDTGSQVILNGKVWKNLNARNYYESKKHIQESVFQAYDDLSSEYDAIVLEGAGSPGEVNLKKYDMVNMPMARYAESNVVLVGDIDRGGVYASFIGHMEVMEEWERKLLKGFLVNKFRGDETLLDDAHVYLSNFTGKPVLGVMPYAKDHRMPEEDGVDFKERYSLQSNNKAELTIGVISLPHISNSTDIDPLLNYEDVQLIQINTQDDLKNNYFHLIIIPGSKNVISDLNYLKKQGIAEEILKLHRDQNTCVLGICGGFQMLGKQIFDPLGIENSETLSASGLSLLPVQTELAEAKTLTLTHSRLIETGEEIKGYEIHHGISKYDSSKELFQTEGLGTYGKRAWGTYLHGILENPAFVSMILNQTRRSHQLSETSYKSESGNQFLEKAIDDFADLFRENIDIDQLLRFTGL